LSSAGINAIRIKCESPRELIEGVRLIGHILGAEERAEEYVSFYNNVRKMISTRLRGLKSSQRVRVYISGSGGILSSCGRKMYQSTVIDQAGGRNVASSISAGGWANVSPEQLIRWNPSVIFAVQYGHSMTPCPATPEDIIKDSRFSTIDAIKNGRVYMFPSNISPWDYPSMQSVLGLLWAAKTLHPDRFKDINMTRFANEFYLKFFGKSFRQAGGSL
jgi:iron complex transport system substrate-binding protein